MKKIINIVFLIAMYSMFLCANGEQNRVLNLKAGYNSVSFNREYTLDNMLQSIGSSNLLSVQGVGNNATYKKSYVDNGEGFLNDFEKTLLGKAYWIKVLNEVSIEYAPIIYEENQTISLDVGWNFVAPFTLLTLSEIKEQLGNNNLLVVQGTGSNATYKKSYLDSGEDFLNDFNQFEESKGYWIKVAEASFLTFEFSANNTIYEDGEDNTTSRWSLIEDETNATVSNEYDAERGSQVIVFNGNGRDDGYLIGNKFDNEGSWDNESEFTIQWSMNYNENYKVQVILQTTNGLRYLYYTQRDEDLGHYSDKYIHYGLGVESRNGTWKTFIRNLQEDVDLYEDDNTITAVTGFRIYGSGKVDDIGLHSNDVNLPDTRAPIIHLNGDASITLVREENYIEEGATVSDNRDHNLTVVITGEVNTSQVGTYHLTYTATDLAGNSSFIERIIIIVNANDHVYYISPTGDDDNNGSISAPWKDLEQATDNLVAGNTLILRGGVYRLQKTFNIRCNGTAEAPITIKAYPGEKPILDGALVEFTTAPNNVWEEVDTSRHIYRSVNTYPLSNKYSVFLDASEGGYQLNAYVDSVPFYSDNEVFNGDNDYYVGPGIYYDENDEHIYIRTQYSRYQKLSNETLPDLPGVADIPDLLLPENQDPRQTKLHIGDFSTVVIVEGSYINIDGIDIQNKRVALRVEENIHDINISNGKIQGGRYGISLPNGTHDITMDNIDFPCNVPIWIARSDVKRPQDSPPGDMYEGAAVNMDSTYNVHILNSRIKSCFDGIHFAKFAHDIHIEYNSFDDIRDDTTQMATSGYNYELNNNTITHAYLGFSYNGTGNKELTKVGTTFIHHNIIDTSKAQLLGREDPQDLLPVYMKGFENSGWGSGRSFGAHDSNSVTTPDPWKIYNNTLLVMNGGDIRGFGTCYTHDEFDTTQPHEVYNNIMFMLGDKHMGRGCRGNDGSTIMDGNLYWRVGDTFTKDFFYLFDYESGSGGDSFNSLDELKNSDFFTNSQTHYTPGWEANGLEADPELSEAYRPAVGSVAATGAIDLNSSWSGVDNTTTYQGALSPQ